MSGRKKFEKFKVFIKVFVCIFKCIPKASGEAVYRASFLFNGSIGVLLRYVVNKSYFGGMGDACYFASYTIIKNGAMINVGDRFSLHEFSYIDGVGGVDIGNDVSIANSCSIISFDHGWDNPNFPIKYNSISFHKITICDDVWIGAGVRILSGTYIESRVIVAAGAVVKGRLEAGWIYAGVPAKKIKRI